MTTRIEVDDTVSCQLFNGVERKFYGPRWTTKVLEVDQDHCVGHSLRPYRVLNADKIETWLSRKEIRLAEKQVSFQPTLETETVTPEIAAPDNFIFGKKVERCSLCDNLTDYFDSSGVPFCSLHQDIEA